MNLARALLLRRYPVLLQGPTSSGKTSLVAYMAERTGHGFVRINNHEQTDLQEYVGRYISDETGRLVFKEGLLVQAMRRGDWVVLDELNLAPTEVLEALNRYSSSGGLYRGDDHSTRGRPPHTSFAGCLTTTVSCMCPSSRRPCARIPISCCSPLRILPGSMPGERR